MKPYRFIPLADHPRHGVLVPPEGRAFIARFLTPAQAKAEAQLPLDERS